MQSLSDVDLPELATGAVSARPAEHPDVTPVEACPICGAPDRVTAHAGVPDHKYHVPGSWSFARCVRCSQVYLTTRLVDPAAGYPTEYYQHHVTAVPDAAGADLGPARRVLRRALLARYGYGSPASAATPLLGALLDRVPYVRLQARFAFVLFPRSSDGTRLLEIGCGNGRFCAVMERLGWEVSAVEPDPLAAAAARRVTTATIYPDLDQAPFQAGSFDVVVMRHVLEHIVDPAAVLSRCRQVLRPGGLLGICVPNWNSLSHGVFGAYCSHLEPPRHVLMYTPGTLDRLLTQTGFRVRVLRTTSELDGLPRFRESSAARRGASPGRFMCALAVLASVLSPWLLRGRGEEIISWAERPA